MRTDAAIRRRRLIEAAATIFERDGYGVSLELVAASAGLGRGTLYRNFRDRSALTAAVLAYKVEEMEHFVATHQDDRTLLRTFIRRQGLLASLHATAIARLQADAEHSKMLADLTQRTSELHEQVRVRCQAAGTLRRDAGTQHLRLVTRMLMAIEDEQSGLPQSLLDEAVLVVLEGLAPRCCAT